MPQAEAQPFGVFDEQNRMVLICLLNLRLCLRPADNDSVAFEDLPDDWRCPRCKQPKDNFNRA